MNAQDSDNIYKKVIESSDDSIFVLGPDLKYILVNKTMARNLGKPEDSFAGKSIFDIFPEVVSKQLSLNINKVFSTKASLHLEEKIQIKGGDSFNSSILNPITNDKGEVIAVAGIVRDITAEKQMRDDLNVKIDELSKLNSIAVGRELKMIELKKELEGLKQSGK